MSGRRKNVRTAGSGFSLIELLVVIAVIAILAALLLPALARAKQKGQQAVCLSNLKQIGLAFTMYLNDHDDRFADRRDLKSSLPGGYLPWTTWPASDPRGGWAAIVLKEEGTADNLWSCPAAINSPVGNVVQALQIASTNGIRRYRCPAPPQTYPPQSPPTRRRSTRPATAPDPTDSASAHVAGCPSHTPSKTRGNWLCPGSAPPPRAAALPPAHREQEFRLCAAGSRSRTSIPALQSMTSP